MAGWLMLTLYLRRIPALPWIKVLAGWMLILFVLFFKATFLYVTGVAPGMSFLFLRPPGFGYWAMDWSRPDPLLTPGYRIITGALAGGRGLALPFAIPLNAVSFLLGLVLPVTGFLLIHRFGGRLKWWYLALAAFGILSLSYQATTVRVYIPPDSRVFQDWGRSIDAAAQKTGVDPSLLAAVMLQESGGQPAAVSHDSLGNPVAYGLMQLIPATASRFGLPRQRILDPSANILAGAEYLALLEHDFHGNTDLVLAGYYAGEGAVTSALKRAGLPVSPWGKDEWPRIEPYMPRAAAGQPSVEQYVSQVEQKVADARGSYITEHGPRYLAY